MTVWAGTALGPSLTVRPRQVGGIVPQWERLAMAEIDRAVDDTQAELAVRWLDELATRWPDSSEWFMVSSGSPLVGCVPRHENC